MRISITMFNDFVLCCASEAQSAPNTIWASNMGKELQNLLQILVANRKKHMTRDKLIDVLYPDRKDPVGCLKYAIFRLRGVLKELGEVNLIITDSAGYMMNPEYEYEVDTERFESLYFEYRNASSDDIRAEVTDKLCGLYKGYYYQTPSQMLWTTECREYYHIRFCGIAASQGEEYCLKGQFSKAVELCEKVLAIDAYCEDVSCVFLKALVGDRQYLRAVNYYKNLTKQYMEQFGEPPSQKLRKIFRLITTESISDKLSLDNVQSVLVNETVQKHAFFCNYDIFAHIFQLESRKRMRDHSDDVQLLMIMEISNAVNEEVFQAWMDHLKSCIQETLRLGDAFTRANRKQFLLLALCRRLEDSRIIEERIKNAFFNSPKYAKAEIRTDVTEVLPFEKIDYITQI